MMQKHLTFKTIAPEIRDTSTWRRVDTSEMTPDARERFERLLPAIEDYLRTGKLRKAAEQAALSADAFLAQVNRCISPHPNGGVYGWQGIILGLHLNKYNRKSPPPVGEMASSQGASGAFQQFLNDHPKIKKVLDDAINEGIGIGKFRAAFTTHKSIWRIFNHIARTEISSNEYPLNQKTQARRSVERYVKFMIENDDRARRNETKTSSHVGTGLYSFDLPHSPLDLVGIDAHHIDCIGAIEIDGPAGPQMVAIQRIWIDAVVDFHSRAVLGYSSSFRTEPSATQIELALDMATKPWKRRELTMEGAIYKEGAGFPMGNVDSYKFAPAALRMDSAMQSFATRIVDRVRRRFGCALSWSAVGAWHHNDTIERFFGLLERYGLHRLPTSVGSGSSDPRRTNGAELACKLKVTWQEILDLLDVALANYNAKSQPGLGYRPPLEVLRDHFDENKLSFTPRPLIPLSMLTPRLGVEIETHIVRGSCAPGKLRRPYVQVDKATYTSPVLATQFSLIGQRLVLHVHEEDMRSLEAYLVDGTRIGWLGVREKGWRHTKHSRDIRKQINKMCSARELSDISGEDYVQAYLEHLARKTLKTVKQRPYKISQDASQLAEVVRTTGAQLPKNRPAKQTDEDVIPVRAIPALLNLRKPTWDR